MKISRIFVCVLALGACKSSSSAPAEDEGPKEAAPVALAEEATPPQESAEEQPPSPEPDAPAPTETEPPAVQPSSNAPSDVASPPKGAQRTKSGVVSKVLKKKKGKGKSRPGKFDTVTLKYTGWTPDGRMFDSSASHGQAMVVPLNHTIHGFAEGVRLMVAGEKRRLWVPANLAYGETGSRSETAPRQPLGDLVFDIELVSFKKAPEPPEAPKDVGAIPADATRSASGLAWRVLEPGTGSEQPIDTAVVEMAYTVWTSDAEVVDSSTLRGRPDTVGIKRLVPGWTEGMKLMVEGERRMFWIPEDLAYGGASHRPSGMLVVDVTLVQIRRDLHQVH
jgi:peptidylprolyl isomerase